MTRLYGYSPVLSVIKFGQEQYSGYLVTVMSQAVSYEDGGQQLATYLGGLCYFCFLNICIYCYKPLLRTTLSVSLRFWCVVCPFSFLSQYYLSSLFDFFFDPLDFQECVL